MQKQHSVISQDEIRAAFPVLSKVIYLNVGTYGIMPQPALDSFLTYIKEFEVGGVACKVNLGELTENTRSKVACLIGAESPDTIAFNRNATDGINFLLAGINLEQGDEVISTNEEHEAMFHPLLYLQKMKGIKVHWIDFSADPDQVFNQLNRCASERTRLIAFSLVSCETGTRFPGYEVCSWAAERKILTLVDGAQATGNIPVNVQSIGCDFYASNGHKWLFGPKGTGFFYGRLDKLDSLFLPYVGAGSLEKAVIETGDVVPWKNARKFEYGTRSWGLHAGLGDSLSWFDAIGWDNIYLHTQSMSDQLKAMIIERPHLQLLSPIDWDQSSGLVTFSVRGYNAGDVSRILNQKKNIHVRVIPHYNAIRISTAIFNNDEDLENLLIVLDSLV